MCQDQYYSQDNFSIMFPNWLADPYYSTTIVCQEKIWKLYEKWDNDSYISQ